MTPDVHRMMLPVQNAYRLSLKPASQLALKAARDCAFMAGVLAAAVCATLILGL